MIRDIVLSLIGRIFLFYYDSVLVTGVLLGLALLVRYLLRKRSKRLICLVWGILLIRLLVPVTFRTEYGRIPGISELMGIESVLDSRTDDNRNVAGNGNVLENYTTEYDLDNIWIDGGDRDHDPAYKAQSESGESAAFGIFGSSAWKPEDIRVRLIGILSVIWLIGAAGLTIRYRMRIRRLHTKARFAIRHHSEKDVYIWPDETGACVLGMIHPIIYLPFGLTKVEEAIILRHERAHIKRRDYILVTGYLTALILNWMNPLVWAAYYLCKEDIEMACDEEALSSADISFRQAYARLLLAYTSGSKNPALLSFGYGNLKKRFERIGRRYSMRKWQKAVTVVLSVLVMLLGAAACGTTDSDQRNGSGEQHEILYPEAIPLGADLPVFDYVDGEKVIFHDYARLYVYDIEIGGIVDVQDLEPYDLNHTQGDEAVFFSVNATGDRVYITNASETIAYTYYVNSNSLKEGFAQHEPMWQGEPAENVKDIDGYTQVGSAHQMDGIIYYLVLSSTDPDNASQAESDISDEQEGAAKGLSMLLSLVRIEGDAVDLYPMIRYSGTDDIGKGEIFGQNYERERMRTQDNDNAGMIAETERMIAENESMIAENESMTSKNEMQQSSEDLHMLDSSFDTDYILVEDTVVENDYFHLTIPEELVGKLGYAMVIRGGGYGVTFFADDMRDYSGILYGLSYDEERAEAYHLAEPANTQCRAEDLERYLEYQKLLKDAILNSYVPNNSNFTGTI
ncbi:MAG: M56 family metallopeptidase [Lachnospiraceae bacterium]|nr:M56 family metallopeptidase [Lachnospiraceae bacterium]